MSFISRGEVAYVLSLLHSRLTPPTEAGRTPALSFCPVPTRAGTRPASPLAPCVRLLHKYTNVRVFSNPLFHSRDTAQHSFPRALLLA